VSCRRRVGWDAPATARSGRACRRPRCSVPGTRSARHGRRMTEVRSSSGDRAELVTMGCLFHVKQGRIGRRPVHHGSRACARCANVCPGCSVFVPVRMGTPTGGCGDIRCHVEAGSVVGHRKVARHRRPVLCSVQVEPCGVRDRAPGSAPRDRSSRALLGRWTRDTGVRVPEVSEAVTSGRGDAASGSRSGGEPGDAGAPPRPSVDVADSEVQGSNPPPTLVHSRRAADRSPASGDGLRPYEGLRSRRRCRGGSGRLGALCEGHRRAFPGPAQLGARHRTWANTGAVRRCRLKARIGRGTRSCPAWADS
jgi:hypothetical protein